VRVFLTGGSGLLGSHTAQQLVEGGSRVVALCRPESDRRFLERLRCDIATGDVLDPVDRLVRAMEGCTHVVHAAALVYRGGTWEAVSSVNVEGARRVMSAAADAGVRHVVHVSSVAVYGTLRGPVHEGRALDVPLEPRDTYARSKREAERVVRAQEGARNLPVTILRPAGIYGERDRLLAPRVARMIRTGVAFTLGAGRDTRPVVYAGNVADAVIRCLRAGRGQVTYDLGMDHPLTQRMLVEGIAKGMGRSPVVVTVPAALLRGGAHLLRRIGISRLRPGGVPVERAVALALDGNPYRAERIRAELGWEPPHRHEDALWRTGRWLMDARKKSEE